MDGKKDFVNEFGHAKGRNNKEEQFTQIKNERPTNPIRMVTESKPMVKQTLKAEIITPNPIFEDPK